MLSLHDALPLYARDDEPIDSSRSRHRVCRCRPVVARASTWCSKRRMRLTVCESPSAYRVCATREEKGMSGIPQTGSVLEQFVRWESAFADRTYMTQPGTHGSITNSSWGRSEARRVGK